MRVERGLLKALGPGLMMAGASVGVSHLVQSTRAGASYGFALIGLVIIANLAKYPAFRFGPEYAAATGTSLLEGYRRQGRWALGLYAILTLGTMFTVTGAVAFVTAALAKITFGLSLTPQSLTIILLLLCGLVSLGGRFKLLDQINKVVVVIFTVATLISTVLLLPQIEWSAIPVVPDWDGFSIKDIMFCAALVGWMPSAIDISVWHSLWTLARKNSSGHQPTRRQALADFHLGYWGTALLALCFVTLGAGVMYGRAEFAGGAVGFAAQVIRLYVDTLGEWSRALISASAFAVMFSTTLAVADGFPRAIATLVERFLGPETPWESGEGSARFRLSYWAAFVLIALGAILVVSQFLTSLKGLVDLATTLSFLTAPILAVLNHRAILSAAVPLDARPSRRIIIASRLGIVFLSTFALYYIWLRFLG